MHVLSRTEIVETFDEQGICEDILRKVSKCKAILQYTNWRSHDRAISPDDQCGFSTMNPSRDQFPLM